MCNGRRSLANVCTRTARLLHITSPRENYKAVGVEVGLKSLITSTILSKLGRGLHILPYVSKHLALAARSCRRPSVGSAFWSNALDRWFSYSCPLPRNRVVAVRATFIRVWSCCWCCCFVHVVVFFAVDGAVAVVVFFAVAALSLLLSSPLLLLISS